MATPSPQQSKVGCSCACACWQSGASCPGNSEPLRSTASCFNECAPWQFKVNCHEMIADFETEMDLGHSGMLPLWPCGTHPIVPCAARGLPDALGQGALCASLARMQVPVQLYGLECAQGSLEGCAARSQCRWPRFMFIMDRYQSLRQSWCGAGFAQATPSLPSQPLLQLVLPARKESQVSSQYHSPCTKVHASLAASSGCRLAS